MGSESPFAGFRGRARISARDYTTAARAWEVSGGGARGRLAGTRRGKLSSRLSSDSKSFGGRNGLALPLRLSTGRGADALAGGRQRATRALGRPSCDGLARLVRRRHARAPRLQSGVSA